MIFSKRIFPYTMGPIKMSLYVNSACNLTCEECIMKHLMKSDMKYQMSLEEVQKLIDVSEESKYKFDFVLTGGDPLLWKNLERGLVLLRGSVITNTITMFTNAMFHKRLTEKSVECLDHIRISQYEGNEKHIEELMNRCPKKTSYVGRMEFWKNPDAPVEKYEPVVCLNPECLLYNYKVYSCPHSASIAENNKSKVKISKNLEVGFLKGMQKIRQNQHKEICSMCISNKTVREQVEKIKNVC